MQQEGERKKKEEVRKEIWRKKKEGRRTVVERGLRSLPRIAANVRPPVALIKVTVAMLLYYNSIKTSSGMATCYCQVLIHILYYHVIVQYSYKQMTFYPSFMHIALELF